MDKPEKIEPVLQVYSNRSILVDEDGATHQYDEGKISIDAKKRLLAIKEALDKGFLENVIAECKSPTVDIQGITPAQISTIESLVNSVTSEVGRAIVGLTILQLTVKAILPEQSIRLHKASAGGEFSWKEGIPMRVLDKNYITPVLRHYNLMRLNADGFMMTRSLAENYPYSKLYKAAIRGAKKEWLEITDSVERGTINSEDALKQLLIFLNSKSEAFQALTETAVAKLDAYLQKKPAFADVNDVITTFIDVSTYSARMFEVALHSLFQVLEEEKSLSGFLKPLSQMRSANKKHGNIGDIELTLTQGSLDIIEAWDAKYGKTYLRDELEELNDKLKSHPQVAIAGFVTDQKPNLKSEITERIEEMQLIHNTEIFIMDFTEWVPHQIAKYDLDADKVGAKWLTAILESICQKRRSIAPIDEPTTEWVQTLIDCLG